MIRRLLLACVMVLIGTFSIAQTSPYCGTEVFHFDDNPASAVILTVSNVDANTMIVEIESPNPADPVDFLLVNGGSGAAISAEDFSVPGKISRTLTWAGTPPADVVLNILWSFQSFPGNWQLSQGDITIPFAASCTAASAFCETPTLHFGGDPGSEILLTIANVDANSVIVEIESADADPVDFLLITNGSGANITGPTATGPGKLAATLSWTSPPENITLNVLWSKASFPGNWQLSEAEIMVPFAATCPTPPPVPMNPTFCGAETLHFGGDPGSVILLTITNTGANSMVVEVESADADPVDFLLVNGGSGAAISAEDFSVPGKISRTLTWADTPPDEVVLNVLWSKASFPGNWQLSQGDITVDFAFDCNAANIPTMGQWSLFYFALLMLILGIVYIPVFQSRTELALQGANQGNISFSMNQFPFEMNTFMQALKITLILVPFGFAFIFMVWGELVLDDFVGMFFAIPLVAYLIYLLKR